MTALTPSTATMTTLGTAGLLTTITTGCETDEVDPNAIDRTTDNPAHLAEFMKDVKPVDINSNFGKIGEFSFTGVWNGREYKFSTVCKLNAETCVKQLESDAKQLKKTPEEMGMEFFYKN